MAPSWPKNWTPSKWKLAGNLLDSIDFQEYKDIIDIHEDGAISAELNEERVEDLSAMRIEALEKEGDKFNEKWSRLIEKHTNSDNLLLLLEQLTSLFVKQKEKGDNIRDGSREVDNMTLKPVRCLKHSLVNFRV